MAGGTFQLSLQFRAPVSVFTGLGVAGLVDRTILRDAEGVPYIPGSTVKGRLRFFAERVLRSAPPTGYSVHTLHQSFCRLRIDEPACTLCRLFGAAAHPALIRVSPARLPKRLRETIALQLRNDPNPVCHPDVEIRPGIALSRLRRTALAEHLFFDEAFPVERFEGSIWLDSTVTEAEERFVIGVGKLVDALGSRKAAGRGALVGGIVIERKTS